MNGIALGGLVGVGKLFFTLAICGGVLAFSESKLWTFVALGLCMALLF
jgi:hypothetical protein